MSVLTPESIKALDQIYDLANEADKKSERITSLESQLKEARELVKGLAGAMRDIVSGNVACSCSSWEQCDCSDRHAEQCLKDNAEAIERLTKEEK